MPYYRYSKTVHQGQQTHYQQHQKHKQPERIQLFGRNGLLCNHLRAEMQPQPPPPWRWHIDVDRIYGLKNEAVVIDMRPPKKPTNNRTNGNLLIFELRNVCGYSQPNWTTYMWHMRALIKDKARGSIDPENFDWQMNDEQDENVYTFGYVNHNVQLKPFKLGGGRAASVLLWPDVTRYFADCIKRLSPGIIP